MLCLGFPGKRDAKPGDKPQSHFSQQTVLASRSWLGSFTLVLLLAPQLLHSCQYHDTDWKAITLFRGPFHPKIILLPNQSCASHLSPDRSEGITSWWTAVNSVSKVQPRVCSSGRCYGVCSSGRCSITPSTLVLTDTFSSSSCFCLWDKSCVMLQCLKDRKSVV